MPFISITVAEDLELDRHGILTAINGAVAASLGLAPDDVHSQLSLASAGATGTTVAAPWPLALLHGRRRDPVAMTAAADVVTEVLARFTGSDPRSVWVQWVTST